MGKLPMKNDIFNSSSKLVVTIRENTLPIIGGNKKYLKKNLIFNVCHVSSFEYHWKPQQFIGQLMRSGNLISELLCMLWRSESHLAFLPGVLRLFLEWVSLYLLVLFALTCGFGRTLKEACHQCQRWQKYLWCYSWYPWWDRDKN